MESADLLIPVPDDAPISPALPVAGDAPVPAIPLPAQETHAFLTPQLDVDSNRLAFIGPIEPGREAETFATLLTFTVFAERPERVIDEAYSSACASTGAASRLDEDSWYHIAREYFEEFLEFLKDARMTELEDSLAWLDKHFFARHPGYEDARLMIERYLITRGQPLH